MTFGHILTKTSCESLQSNAFHRLGDPFAQRHTLSILLGSQSKLAHRGIALVDEKESGCDSSRFELSCSFRLITRS